MAPLFPRLRRPAGVSRRLFLRSIVPRARLQARSKLADFNFGTVPLLRSQLHSRLYRYFLLRKARRQKRKASGLIARIRRSGLFTWLRLRRRNARKVAEPAFGVAGVLRRMEPIGQGRRRQKLAGYFKAANELRQTYQQSYMQSWGTRDGQDEYALPGAYPDAQLASGEDELVIFPSYARRHDKTRRVRCRSAMC